jgi:hypothetical protein
MLWPQVATSAHHPAQKRARPSGQASALEQRQADLREADGRVAVERGDDPVDDGESTVCQHRRVQAVALCHPDRRDDGRRHGLRGLCAVLPCGRHENSISRLQILCLGKLGAAGRADGQMVLGGEGEIPEGAARLGTGYREGEEGLTPRPGVGERERRDDVGSEGAVGRGGDDLVTCREALDARWRPIGEPHYG